LTREAMHYRVALNSSSAINLLFHLVSYAGINQIRFNGIHIRDLSLLIEAPRQDIICMKRNICASVLGIVYYEAYYWTIYLFNPHCIWVKGLIRFLDLLVFIGA
jgi:hypothetical protein